VEPGRKPVAPMAKVTNPFTYRERRIEIVRRGRYAFARVFSPNGRYRETAQYSSTAAARAAGRALVRAEPRDNPMSLVGVRPDKPWTTGEYIALGLVGIGVATLGYLIWQQQTAPSAQTASSTNPASTTTSTTAQTPAPAPGS
jgi:hypothetical protein